VPESLLTVARLFHGEVLATVDGVTLRRLSTQDIVATVDREVRRMIPYPEPV
jgi:hypothetical protein